MKAKILLWENDDKYSIGRIFFEPDFEKGKDDLMILNEHETDKKIGNYISVGTNRQKIVNLLLKY